MSHFFCWGTMCHNILLVLSHCLDEITIGMAIVDRFFLQGGGRRRLGMSGFEEGAQHFLSIFFLRA